jgi:hypothetical protein
MTAGREGPRQSGPAKGDHFVFWDPCLGLEPITVEEPRAWLKGQAVVLAISLGLFGLLFVLAPLN